jgi:hypothetical protein
MAATKSTKHAMRRYNRDPPGSLTVPASCHLPASFPNRLVAHVTLLSLTCLSWLGGCSRTGLDADGFDGADVEGVDVGTFRDAAADADEQGRDRAADAASDSSLPRESSIDPPCKPAEETCNGVDDDCNGQVDEGIAPVPCPNGGFRYCVGGRSSACPTRCEVCVPGSQRVCFVSYCLYWGIQTCAGDGKSFGPCREQRPPSECDATARAHGASPELERCCVDHGYCCLDAYDLDADGNRGDLVGSCGGVSCEP